MVDWTYESAPRSFQIIALYGTVDYFTVLYGTEEKKEKNKSEHLGAIRDRITA